jgi:hypothetical protein
VKKSWALLFIFCAFVGMSLQAADELPAKVSIDPDKAGPDYKIQGEYLGETADKAKLGAEVITRADEKNKTVTYLVNFLPGGLRGDGGDYAKHVPASGKVEGDKVVIASKDGKWNAAIQSGKLTGKTAEGQAFTLERVERKSKTEGQKPPEGAIILFDGKNADEWKGGKMTAGNLEGTDCRSKKGFKDHKAHVEFRLSYMPYQTGQGRSNSGVYVQDRWEIQVLDSFGLKGENNECGGIYSQFKQQVNMCYPPLTWQTYDIEFKAARFAADGKKTANAVLTVYHNGVLIHDKVELSKGKTGGGQDETDTPGPYQLQGHGGQVQYRNIWVVETK